MWSVRGRYCVHTAAHPDGHHARKPGEQGESRYTLSIDCGSTRPFTQFWTDAFSWSHFIQQAESQPQAALGIGGNVESLLRSFQINASTDNQNVTPGGCPNSGFAQRSGLQRGGGGALTLLLAGAEDHSSSRILLAMRNMCSIHKIAEPIYGYSYCLYLLVVRIRVYESNKVC